MEFKKIYPQDSPSEIARKINYNFSLFQLDEHDNYFIEFIQGENQTPINIMLYDGEEAVQEMVELNGINQLSIEPSLVLEDGRSITMMITTEYNSSTHDIGFLFNSDVVTPDIINPLEGGIYEFTFLIGKDLFLQELASFILTVEINTTAL